MPTNLPVPPDEGEDTTLQEKLDNEYGPQPLWLLDWGELGFAYSGVYVIAPGGAWPNKIGISCCVPRRLIALQTSHWQKLHVFDYWLCENAKAARTVERSVHKILADDGKLLMGEWFDVRSNQASKVVEYAADREGIELARRIPETEKFAHVHQRLSDMDLDATERKLKEYARDTAKPGAKPGAVERVYDQLPDSMFMAKGPEFNGRITERRRRRASGH